MFVEICRAGSREADSYDRATPRFMRPFRVQDQRSSHETVRFQIQGAPMTHETFLMYKFAQKTLLLCQHRLRGAYLLGWVGWVVS